MKNLPEFKKLIERYESITIEEIEYNEFDKSYLTGFGSHFSCTLCIAINKRHDNSNCKECVFYRTLKRQVACALGRNAKTYDAIDNILYSDDSKELLTAYRNRAKHMRSILKKLNIEMP